MMEYKNQLTVVIRNDGPMIHCGDSPSYRAITILLTDEQLASLKLRDMEEISKCFIEPDIKPVVDKPLPF